MGISKRTLEKWRKDALESTAKINARNTIEENWTEPIANSFDIVKSNQKILQLTQELLDQHLLQKR